MMFRCNKLARNGDPCTYWSSRRWNLERHIADTHPPLDEWKELKDILSYLELPNGDPRANTSACDDARKSEVWTHENTVAIMHPFPASTIHYLLFPRCRQNSSPSEAFSDSEFRTMILKEAASLKKIAGKQLQRRYGRYSQQDIPREAMLNGDVDLPENGELPIGRDWEKDIKVGILANTTLDRLHIHLVSIDVTTTDPDMYNHFTSTFFIDIAELPLPGTQISHRVALNPETKCWRCGQQYANFSELKEHLASEVEEWRAQ